ncbi:MAG: molybdopterin dinucleotide binding domain-containing protein, partial [Caulobacterales bacterium]
HAYDALAPIQWPVTKAGGTARLFAGGAFPTPDGRARMVPVRPQGPAQATDGAFPLALNTGRVRDHWHTLTRTGLAPDLCRHVPEPFVEIHPADAEPLGLTDGALARVRTAQGEAVALARISDRQRRGSIFMPMHWTAAFAPSGRANPLVAAEVDPISGQPEFKHTPARVRPYRETWRGFFLARDAWTTPAGLDLVWRRIPQGACQLHEFAGRGDRAEREALRLALTRGAPSEGLRFEDDAAGCLREAYLEGERLERVLFTAIAAPLPPRAWLAALFALDALAPADRIALLIGRAPGQAAEPAPLVCVCSGVRADSIQTASSQGARTVEAIGQTTGAGDVCGACRPEIGRILAQRALSGWQPDSIGR